MPEISLTTFVDFVIASGTPRITAVRKAKDLYDQDYNPAFDYWKNLRETIINLHKNGRPKSVLDDLLAEVSPRKEFNYRRCVESYKRWLGRKSIEWIGCSQVTWDFDTLAVKVNP